MRVKMMTYDVLEEIWDLYNHGYSSYEISMKLKRSVKTISAYITALKRVKAHEPIGKATINLRLVQSFVKEHGMPEPIVDSDEPDELDFEDDSESSANETEATAESLKAVEEVYDLKRLIQSIDRLSNTIEVFWRNSRANMSASYAAEGGPKYKPLS